MDIDFNAVTSAYLNLRDARSKLRKQFDEQDGALSENQRKLEAVMLDHLNKSGSESIRTQSATFYRQEKIKPAGSDWDALYKWIAENDGFEFLERRIKATAVKEYMDEHDGQLPPGVSVFREYEVRVRRAS